MAATQGLSAATGGGGGNFGAPAGGGGAPRQVNSRGLLDTVASPRQPGETPAQWFTRQPDDYRFANMDSRPEADPGFTFVEDGTQVPFSFFD